MTAPTRWKVLKGAGLGSAAIVWLWFRWQDAFEHFAKFRFDDTFIFLRYAHNLARHGHLSFNLDDRVDGFTSPGWTLVLSAVELLRADGPSWASRLSGLCGFGSVLAAAFLAFRWGAHPLAAVAVAGVGTMSIPGFVAWSAPGMDMPWAALTGTLALATFPPADPWSPRVDRVLRVSRAVLLVLAALARPELLVIALPLLAWDALGPDPRTRAATGWRTVLSRPATIALGFLAFAFLAHWAYYGWPAPNTYYFKRGTEFLEAYGRRDLPNFLNDTLAILGPVAALALLGARATIGVHGAASLVVYLAWFAGTCWMYARSGGDYMGFHRFYQPLVPASFAAFAALFARIDTRAGIGRHVLSHLAAGAIAAAAAYGLPLRTQESMEQSYARGIGGLLGSTRDVEDWQRAAAALRRSFPEGTRLAVRAAGVLTYRTGFPAYDMLGLNNAEVAHGPSTANFPGHQREATVEQVLAWRPDVIVGHPDVGPASRGVTVQARLADPRYAAAGFVPRCLDVGEGRTVCVLVRSGLGAR